VRWGKDVVSTSNRQDNRLYKLNVPLLPLSMVTQFNNTNEPSDIHRTYYEQEHLMFSRDGKLRALIRPHDPLCGVPYQPCVYMVEMRIEDVAVGGQVYADSLRASSSGTTDGRLTMVGNTLIRIRLNLSALSLENR
jgi:hypothetical protein